MSAVNILAKHRKLWSDGVASCAGCDWTRCGTLTRTDLSHAAHQLDALKAAGFLALSVEEFGRNSVGLVLLPEPDYMPTTFDWAQGLGVWEFGEGGRVAAWSDGYMVDENGNAIGGVDVARAWAAALLAACAAVDAVERSETTR